MGAAQARLAKGLCEKALRSWACSLPLPLFREEWAPRRRPGRPSADPFNPKPTQFPPKSQGRKRVGGLQEKCLP